MPPISLLIKPASSNCNLRCKYCFYHSIAENRTTSSYGMMSLETLEVLVRKALEHAEYSCTFAFQGGEPTLAGLDFFRKLIEYVNIHNNKKIKINYALQTNGMVINDEWAQFLHDNGFLVGLSLDGNKDIHDLLRVDAEGKGTFNRVMSTATLFNKYKVEYNILCVVNASLARHINKVYNFFKKNGFHYLQFIPCLDPLEEVPGGYEHSLQPERYAQFLKSLFDEWYKDITNGQMISIRFFDNLVGMAMGQPPESCGMSGFCTAYYVIEADGGVYPCDFYVTDSWHMGNIREDDFVVLGNSEVSKKFVEVSKHVDPKCKECRWYGLCRGGCRRDREPFVDGKPVLNRYCEAYKEFYPYATERISQLARRFSR